MTEGAHRPGIGAGPPAAEADLGGPLARRRLAHPRAPAAPSGNQAAVRDFTWAFRSNALALRST